MIKPMLLRLGQGPGAPCEQRHTLAYREIDSLNKGCLDQTSEVMGFQQVIVYLPMIFARAWWTKPPAEMSCNRMEGAQAIRGEGWNTNRMQTLFHFMRRL
jgi:hypothetical protein